MRIYLAIPYSFNPNFSFKVANKVAAKLMQEGHSVFSPISQGHVIADHLPDSVRTDSGWWDDINLPQIDHCDEVWVVSIGETGLNLIQDSVGCQTEMAYARHHRKPIKIIDYEF